MRQNTSRWPTCVCALVLMTGCMPKFTVEEMKAMMPERPVELDLLNMFEGSWESEATMNMALLDEPLTGKATSTASWECDDWWMVERGEHEMGELGTMHYLAIWGYDVKAKKYRSWWFDSMGSAGRGTAKYNEETKTWRIKAKSKSSMGKTVGDGTAKYLDDRTVEWTWTEWDGLKLIKFMEGSGTSHKK